MRGRSSLVASIAGAIVLAASLASVPARSGVDELSREPDRAPVRAARLWVGFAEVIQFDRSIGTIVVGDAQVVDATVVDEQTVVLTALAAGRTNVIVLGQDGAVLSRLSAVVRAPEPPIATLYRGTAATTLVCDPDCRPAPAAAAGQPPE